MLTSCATAAQKQTEQIRLNMQTTMTQMQGCVESLYYAPESELLRRHAPINIQEATLEQLTDPAMATDEEIRAIYLQHPKLQECRTIALNRLSTVVPTLLPILVDAYEKYDTGLIELIQRKIAWGELVKRNKAVYAEVQRQWSDAVQQINASLQRSHEAELVQRQAAADALVRYSQTQQMINALYRPVTTTCTGTSYTVNCTSY